MQDYRTDTGFHFRAACCGYMLAMRLHRLVLRQEGSASLVRVSADERISRGQGCHTRLV